MSYFIEQYGLKVEEFFQVNKLEHNHSWASHLHRAYELIFATKGAIALYVDKQKYVLTEGNLAFIFSNQIHSYLSLGSISFVVLFSPEMIKDFYLAHKEYIPENNIITTPKWLDFNKLDSIYNKKSALYALCDNLLKSTQMNPRDSSFHSSIHIPQQIFTYVERHFGEDCNLKKVACALQYDYAYLSKLFTHFVGITFTTYLNNYRILQACTALTDSNESISEIAERCGYNNLRTFNRNFQKIMNCSPQAYRLKSTNYNFQVI